MNSPAILKCRPFIFQLLELLLKMNIFRLAQEQADRMQEVGFVDVLFHLQTHHGAEMCHLGIFLSIKSAFQNTSFAHKMTGIIV